MCLFSRFGLNMCGKKLRYLNLTGCTKITDLTLERLAYALELTSVSSSSDIEDVQRTNSYLCFHGSNSVIAENIQQQSDVHRNCSTAGTVICKHTALSLVSADIFNHDSSDVIRVSNHTEKCSPPQRYCDSGQTAVCCKDMRSGCFGSGQNKDQRSRLSVTDRGPLADKGLEFLSLSGCYQITDAGLRWILLKIVFFHLSWPCS